MNNKDKVFLTTGVTAIIVASGVVGYALMQDDVTTNIVANSADAADTTSAANTTTSTNTAESASTSTTTTSYKDGTYTASTTYSVPRRTNTIKVTVTIVDGKVTAAAATHTTSDRESVQYVDDFESSLSTAAVGQSVDGLSLSRVGGASLTTNAFDIALDTIRSNARA